MHVASIWLHAPHIGRILLHFVFLVRQSWQALTALFRGYDIEDRVTSVLARFAFRGPASGGRSKLSWQGWLLSWRAFDGGAATSEPDGACGLGAAT